VLECKEIENFLLVPSAIDRALKRKVEDQARRTGSEIEYDMNSAKILDEFSTSKKRYVTSQILAETRSFFRRRSPSLAESSVAEMALDAVEDAWQTFDSRLQIIPGKEAIAKINDRAQENYGVSITPTAIIDAMLVEEIPAGMKKLVGMLVIFSKTATDLDADEQ